MTINFEPCRVKTNENVRSVASLKRTTMSVVMECEIRDQVILLGKGGNQLHQGNLRLSHIVQMHREAYQTAPKFEKTTISMSIVDMMTASGARFLKVF